MIVNRELVLNGESEPSRLHFQHKGALTDEAQAHEKPSMGVIWRGRAVVDDPCPGQRRASRSQPQACHQTHNDQEFSLTYVIDSLQGVCG